MPGNTTSLYSSTGSSATVSGTNTSGLYGGTGSYVVGTAAYGNVNVAAFLQSYTGNLQAGNATILGNLAADGVLTDNYYYANGAPVSFAGTYSNANVANYLPIYSGNLAAGNAAISGEITAATVSASGNITGSYILGNGSQLTGLPQPYGNANVSAFLPTYTGNLQAGNLEVINDGNINNDLYVGGTIYGTFSGNISGNLVVPGVNTDVIFNNSGNAGASSDFQFNDATNVLTVNGTANVNTLNATGNITGNYIFGNGSQLTGLPATYGNANVSNFLATGFGSNSISTTGSITAALFTGNLQGKVLDSSQTGIQTIGNTSSASPTLITGNGINIQPVSNSDMLMVATGFNTDIVLGGSGAFASGNLYVGQSPTNSSPMPTILNSTDIYVQGNLRNDTGNITIIDNVDVTGAVVATGNVTGSYIIGDGSLLTNITAGNIIGAYGNANVSDFLANGFGSNTITTTGNITANTFVGQLNGNVIQPLQFGIEAIGNPTNSVSVFGNGVGIQSYTDQDISIVSSTTNSHINMVTFGSGVAADINIGALGGATANVRIRGANLNAEQNISATGNVTAARFNGNLQGKVLDSAQLGIQLIGNDSSATSTAIYGNGIVIQPLVGSDMLVLATGANTDILIGGSSANANGVLILGQSPLSSSPMATVLNSTEIYVQGNLRNNLGNIAIIDNVDVTGAVSATGNITGSYILGNGSQLTGITGTYGNANVANYLPTYTGNIGAGNVIFTNNTGRLYVNEIQGLSGAGLSIAADGTENINLNADTVRVGDNNTDAIVTTHGTGDMIINTNDGTNSGNIRIFDGVNGNIDINPNGTGAVNISGTAGLRVADGISATGNITGSYFIGNGSQLTGITGSGTLAGNMSGNISGVSLYNISGLTSLSASSVATDVISSPSGDFVTIEGVVATNGGTMSGNLGMLNQKAVAFYELTANGSSAVLIRAPEALSQDYIYQLPNSYGTANQALLTDGTGNMTWGSALTGNMSGNISGVSLYNISGLTSLSASSVATDTISSPSGDFVTIEGVIATNGGQMSGNLVFNNQQGVILREQTSSGTNYVQLKSYPSLSTDTIYLLPNDGANGQVLTTSGTGNLSWTTVSGGTSSNSFSTIAANGTNIVATSSTDTLTLTAGTNITITGNAATDTITISAAGGSGSPGGSDTQVQYNDGGAFGGMTTVTFTDSGANTGDLAIGNIIFASNNTSTNANLQTFNNWIKNANDKIGNSSTANTYTPGRYLFGKGLGGTPGSGGVAGSFGVNMDQDGALRNARVAIADRYTATDTGVRSSGLMNYNWIDLSGNIGSANSNTRLQGIVSALNVGGNGAGNLVNSGPFVLRAFTSAINIGTTANANVGNAVVHACTSYGSFISSNSGSEVKNGINFFSGFGAGSGSTFGNAYGLSHNYTNSVTLNKISLVHLQNSSGNGWGQGSTLPTNYLFLDNTDTRSSSLVGPIKEYYDRPYTFTTTTGSTNLDWNNGTAQYLKPTGNVTLAFANALTSSNGNLFHTVTLVVEQGTTPYTITLPTANATIKYAGAVSTVGATANAVIMITSTAANINGSTTYLTTVSPEFS